MPPRLPCLAVLAALFSNDDVLYAVAVLTVGWPLAALATVLDLLAG